jgi:NADH:ubiquinone oxidoreductase subunit 2 (subunit N)
MFASAGLPPFGGFLSKYYLLQALMDSNEILLCIFVVLSSIISCVSYLRLIRISLFGDVPKEYHGISLNVKINHNALLVTWFLLIFGILVIFNHPAILVIIYTFIEGILFI